ncbi:MAG: MFS transporter [Acetobacteraceae bacterium]|nr:MFS transporter [Acetobacteraceae bacterium]
MTHLTVTGLTRFRVLGVVTFALFMDYLIYGLIVPLVPYSPAGAMSEDRLALLYSAYALGVLAATPLFGLLGERIGYRSPMVLGAALSGTAVVLFWLARNLPLLLLARVVQGASAAATWTVGLVLVAEHYVQNRVRMMGYALVGSTAGSIVGPVMGGGLQQLGGYSLPLAVTAGLVAVDLSLRVFLLPAERAHAGSRLDLRSLLLDRSVLVPALATALAAFGWGIVEPLLPAYLERGGATAAEIGVIFTAAPITYGLCAPLVAWASERVAIRWVIAFGIVGMACSLAAISQLSGIVSVGCGLCMLSATFAFTLNPSSAELGNAVDRRGLSCYAAVYAVYNIAYSVGMMATNALAGTAARWASLPHVLLGGSVALLVSVPLLLLKGPQAEPVKP